MIRALFFVALILVVAASSHTALARRVSGSSGGYYTAGDPIVDVSGPMFPLTYVPSSHFAGNSSLAYRALRAHIHSTSTARDFRLRIVPDTEAGNFEPLIAPPFPVFVVPSDVVWFSDPAALKWQVPEYKPENVDWLASVSGLGDITVSSAASSGGTPKQDSPPLLRVLNLTFETYNVRFAMEVPAHVLLFGYGEHDAPFCLNCDESQLPRTMAILNTDEPGYVGGGKPLYGSHPVLYMVDEDALTYTVIQFLSSQPQRLIIEKESSSSSSTSSETKCRIVRFEFLGGIIDAMFIRRNSFLAAAQAWSLLVHPSHDAQQNKLHSPYGDICNRQPQAAAKKVCSPEPLIIPPYWVQGVVQSRWGWRNTSDLIAAESSITNAGLKLDMVLVDIDMMSSSYRVLTVDKERFPNLRSDFVDKLRARSKYFGSIVDPGVAADTSFDTYNDLIASGAYIRRPADNEQPNAPAIAVVWPGMVVLPDWSARAKLQPLMDKYVGKFVEDSGAEMLWTDMNEASCFESGNCDLWTVTNNSMPGKLDWQTIDWAKLPGILAPFCKPPSDNSTFSQLNYLFDPADDDWLQNGNYLYSKSIDMASVTVAGLYYSTRNMYAFYENSVLRRSLEAARPGKRPFLLSRASFIGQGKVSAIWLGDNNPEWADLRASISGVLAAALWGLHIVGGDIGGFGGAASPPELMLRWSQVGMFYTWARYHKNNRVLSPDPVLPSEFPPQVVASIRRAQTTRYRLAPYAFSGIFHASRTGAPFLRHPVMQYGNNNARLLLQNDPQTGKPRTFFMYGESILVVPVAEEGQRTVNILWPGGAGEDTTFHSLYYPHEIAGRGATIEPSYPADLGDDTPAFIRAGSIIPVHGNTAPQSISLCRDYSYDLIVVIDAAANGATGFAYYDDQRDGPVTASNFLKMEYSATVAPGGSYGSISSVMRSAAPPALAFRSFQGAPMTITVVYTSNTGGDSGSSGSGGDTNGGEFVAPVPKSCLVNSSFSCRCKKMQTTVGKGKTVGVATVTLEFELSGAPLDATMPWHLTWSSETTTTRAPLPPTTAVPVPDRTTAVPPAMTASPWVPTTAHNESSNNSNSTAGASSGGDQEHFNRALLGICICLGVFLTAALVAIVWIKQKKGNDETFYAELNSTDFRRN